MTLRLEVIKLRLATSGLPWFQRLFARRKKRKALPSRLSFLSPRKEPLEPVYIRVRTKLESPVEFENKNSMP
jgi:hypothetical protein